MNQTKSAQVIQSVQTSRPVRHTHPKQYYQPVQSIQQPQPNHNVQTIMYLHPVQPTRLVQTVQTVRQSIQSVRPVQHVIQPVQTINPAFFAKLADSTSTSFGRACVVFAAKLFKQVFKAVSKDDPKSNCYHVFFDKYDDLFKIDAMPQDAEVASGLVEFKIHELLYGPLFNLDGKEDFCTRFDDPKFWKNQWGFNFSPFRVVQKLLKDNGLYFVDHTHKGNIPFLYLYRQLPARDVVKNKPWHNYYIIPELNKKDFACNLLPHREANIAVQRAFDKFVALYMAEEFF